jgi:phage terminase large subunit-like protein
VGKGKPLKGRQNIMSGLIWNTACPGWEEKILAGESLIPPPIFPAEADAGLAIFKELRLVDVLNRPTYGEIGRQWVFDFASSVFGSYDVDSGKRLISEYFLLISKKNSKSSTAAALMMTCLVRNWRESAEFLILSPTVEVASNSFNPARDMIRADEELSDLMLVQEHYRMITNRNTGATLKVVAAANETVGGKKATGILIDECWLFGKMANAENMLREACGGLASRPEGFVIWLTTQSDEAPAGIFAQKLEYARGVRDGRINDNTFLPVLYEYPKSFIDGKKYLDKKYWFITNPNLGASVDEAFLTREYKKAEEAGVKSMQGFLAKHLNIQIATSMKAQRWAGADFWESAAEKVTLETIFERCDVIEIGGDGGGLDDLLGLTVLGRDAVSGVWYWWSHAWCHAIALERRKSESPKYHDFAADGDLTIIDEIGQDVKQFGDIVRKCDASGLLDRIGVDPSGIGAIVDELENGDENGEGKIEHDRIVGISQGWRLNSAIKTTERKVAAKEIIHDGSRMMAWCVGNARVEPKGNAILITKSASGTGKIDPLMAGLSAVALMALNPQARSTVNIYEKNQLIRSK